MKTKRPKAKPKRLSGVGSSRIVRPLSRRDADRIRVLVDHCGALQQEDKLVLFPSSKTYGGRPLAGLTAELDMLLRGFKPVIVCKEV